MHRLCVVVSCILVTFYSDVSSSLLWKSIRYYAIRLQYDLLDSSNNDVVMLFTFSALLLLCYDLTDMLGLQSVYTVRHSDNNAIVLNRSILI